MPYKGNSIEEYFQNLKTLEYNKKAIEDLNISVKLAPLIDSMLNKNDRKRATILQLTENNWFKSIKKNETQLGLQAI